MEPKSPGRHFKCHFQHREHVLLLRQCLESLLLDLFNSPVDRFVPLAHQLDIEILYTNGEVGGIKFNWMIELKVSRTNSRDNIGCGVSFREHVLDFETGVNVPLRYFAFLHLFYPLGRQTLTLTHTFRNFEGKPRIHTRFVNKE
ncbi:hypothetical protein D3C81_1345980 [compost metagenome]